MANSRPPIFNLPLEIDVAIADQLPDREAAIMLGRVSNTSTHFHDFFKPELNRRALKALLQAVVDDDRATVKAMLDVNPELLLITPPANQVIESQHTWQKFYAESALNMAAKRRQIEMLKIMMPYLDKLEPTNENEVVQAKTDVLTAWNPQDDIIIPDEYASYAQSLTDAFSEETFPNGKLSEKTELALSSLFGRLLPEQAVKLDDYLDPELFLLALSKVYDDQFDTFRNDDQSDAFCIHVIGLAQSVLSPESAMIFCEGLYYVVHDCNKISDRAASLKLCGGNAFYRASRESLSGLGFEYFCRVRPPFIHPRCAGAELWKCSLKQKLQTYRTYTATPNSKYWPWWPCIGWSMPLPIIYTQPGLFEKPQKRSREDSSEEEKNELPASKKPRKD